MSRFVLATFHVEIGDDVTDDEVDSFTNDMYVQAAEAVRRDDSGDEDGSLDIISVTCRVVVGASLTP